jgi:bacterioferritin-associated ferredoxin
MTETIAGITIPDTVVVKAATELVLDADDDLKSTTPAGCTCGACSSHAAAGIRPTPNSPTSAPCSTISA